MLMSPPPMRMVGWRERVPHRLSSLHQEHRDDRQFVGNVHGNVSGRHLAVNVESMLPGAQRGSSV